MKNKFRIFIVRWIIVTIMMWAMTYAGFSAIAGGFHISEWKEVYQGNFGGLLIFFGGLTAIITAVSVADR